MFAGHEYSVGERRAGALRSRRPQGATEPSAGIAFQTELLPFRGMIHPGWSIVSGPRAYWLRHGRNTGAVDSWVANDKIAAREPLPVRPADGGIARILWTSQQQPVALHRNKVLPLLSDISFLYLCSSAHRRVPGSFFPF